MLREAEATYAIRAEEIILSLYLRPTATAFGRTEQERGGVGPDDPGDGDCNTKDAKTKEGRGRNSEDATGEDVQGYRLAGGEDGKGGGEGPSRKRQRSESPIPAAAVTAAADGDCSGSVENLEKKKHDITHGGNGVFPGTIAEDIGSSKTEKPEETSPCLRYSEFRDGTEKKESGYCIPTTEELRGAILNANDLEAIAMLRADARRYAEEKVAIAEQTFGLVDETVRRLDADLAKFEA